MGNNGLTVERFYKVKPDDSILMVADEISCLSKRHFATVMLESCQAYPPVPFDKVFSNTHREYYQSMLTRTTYFYNSVRVSELFKQG